MKIRAMREIITVNHLLLFDRPVEFSPGQIDYLMSAGFAWDEEGKMLFFKDNHVKIEYLLLKYYESEEDLILIQG